MIDDGEWSDRDEAEGDEEELEEEDEEDDESSSQQPSKKKSKVSESSAIPGLGGDPEPPAPAAKSKTSTSPPIKQPCILIFDSLSGGHRARIVATLRDYLTVEHLQKRKEARAFTRDTMKGAVPRVPQQNNYTDCGLYTLQFTESFFALPLKDYRFPMRTIAEWFDESVVACKREAIALLIKDLMLKYNPTNNIKLPDISFSTAEEREKGGRASCQTEERERLHKLALEKSKDKNAKNKLDNKLPPAEKIPFLGEDNGVIKSAQDPSVSPKATQGNPSKANNTEQKSSDSSVSKAPANSPKVSGNPANGSDVPAKKINSSSKISKPILVRSTDGIGVASKDTPKFGAGVNIAKNKKVLGIIPSVKPFGSPVDNQSKKDTSASKQSTNAGQNSKVVSGGLAAIRDTYSFDEANEEESNNNESGVKQRAAANASVTLAVIPSTGSGNSAAVQVNASIARSTAVTVARLNSLASAKKVSLNGVVSSAETSQASTLTNTQTDVAHLNRYPILASSLGNGRRISNNINNSSSLVVKSDSTVSSSESIAKSTTESVKKVPKTMSLSTDSPSSVKNGQTNQILIGEISGKKAVYSEEGSEVLMFLTHKEGQDSDTPAAAVVSEDGNVSPDLYSDMDALPSQDEGGESDDVFNMAMDLGESSQDSLGAISAGSEQAMPSSFKGSADSENVSSPTASEGTPGSGRSSPTSVCTRSSERVSSSGRSINPPKRFRDGPNPEEGKKKKGRSNNAAQR